MYSEIELSLLMVDSELEKFLIRNTDKIINKVSIANIIIRLCKTKGFSFESRYLYKFLLNE